MIVSVGVILYNMQVLLERGLLYTSTIFDFSIVFALRSWLRVTLVLGTLIALNK